MSSVLGFILEPSSQISYNFLFLLVVQVYPIVLSSADFYPEYGSCVFYRVVIFSKVTLSNVVIQFPF